MPSDPNNSSSLVKPICQQNLEQIWSRIITQLNPILGNEMTDRWFVSAKISKLSESEITVEVPSEMSQIWIEANFLVEFKQALSIVLEGSFEIDFCLKQNQPLQVKKQPKGNVQEKPIKKTQKSSFDAKLTFDRFIVSSSNEFAYGACRSVCQATQPAHYSPLLIQGETGLGKTHLMQSIGQQLLENNPKAKIVYLSCEEFVNQYIEAVSQRKLPSFRKKYRQIDALLIDDIQFLCSKEKSQEEFFYTFNDLVQRQSLIILSSDQPVSGVFGLDSRLSSRFDYGLNVVVKPPSLEVRLAILNQLSKEWNVFVKPEVLELIASNITSNIRRLQGALMRITTYVSLGNIEVDEAKALEIIEDLVLKEEPLFVTTDKIQELVAKHYQLSVYDLLGRRRLQSIAFPRQVAIYLTRKLTKISLAEIGKRFGQRDHGTVIYACKKIESHLEKEPLFKQNIEQLIYSLKR